MSLPWTFDNSYGRLPPGLFTRQSPVPVAAPRLVIVNHRLAAELGLDLAACPPEELARLLAGNALPEGADPLAQAYAGHQFGVFTPLGDGRAILLGERITPDGRRVDLQLKGAGRTPYSRSGDGRAALGPMLREYVIGEAMAALGIPTTRGLAVVATGESVRRVHALPGAVLTRVAASHLRVGTFEYAVRRGAAEVRALVDYTVARHDPDLEPGPDRPLALLGRVMARQAELILAWMRVGFIHGVMNTDNMALSGETLDYGPCAFMDSYDPATVFSSIDQTGRYAFANQPVCAQWNLARFAETLVPLLSPDQVDQAGAMILDFGPELRQRLRMMLAGKLGLAADDGGLVDELLTWMRRTGADYTNTFRALGEDRPVSDDPAFLAWRQRWLARLDDPAAARARMNRLNPAVIPRNHRVEQALAAAEEEGDLAPLRALLAALDDPYRSQPGRETYQRPPRPEERVEQTFCGT